MIYTVTLNPSLDYIISVKDFKLGMTNRADSELLLPGGKGINVSMVLRNLGIESIALGFAAGFTGRELLRRLDEAGVKNRFLSVEKGFTRINVKLSHAEGTEINGQGPEISEKELGLFWGQLEEIEQGDILFLSGSVPGSMPEDSYQKIMEMLDKRQVRIIVDAGGRQLTKVLPFHPFLIKPNHHELGEIFGVEIKTAEQAVFYGKKLMEQGARNVLVSMGGKGAVLLAEDGRVCEHGAPQGKSINAVGAGDAMLAGFMAGYREKGDYEQAFFMGLAAGSASAFCESFARGEEILEMYRQMTGVKGAL